MSDFRGRVGAQVTGESYTHRRKTDLVETLFLPRVWRTEDRPETPETPEPRTTRDWTIYSPMDGSGPSRPVSPRDRHGRKDSEGSSTVLQDPRPEP